MQALQCHPVRSAVYVALLIAGSLGTAHLAVTARAELRTSKARSARTAAPIS